MNRKDRIAKKLGYISEAEHAEIVNKLNDEYRAKLRRKDAENASLVKEIKAQQEINVSKIIEAINGTRFVRMVLSEPYVDFISDDLASPSAINTGAIYPPKPEYITLSAKIDIAGMQRMHSDLQRFPMELEYFTDNFMRTLKNRIKTAMSMAGWEQQ